jgi:hypothetical protein
MACICRCFQTCGRGLERRQMHTCIHTYIHKIHTYKHTCIHTHIHICVYIGAFGRVVEGLNEDTGQFFAVKEVELYGSDREWTNRVKNLEREISIMARLEHPNIVRSESESESEYVHMRDPIILSKSPPHVSWCVHILL